MGREGQCIKQPVDEPINVSNWKMDDEFPVYPEGARDKSLFYSPEHSSHRFLVPNHRYLYKRAVRRHPEQFWTEIIAYHVGCLLSIPVPPAFVAFDDNNKTCGALIEWFLNYPEQRDKMRDKDVPTIGGASFALYFSNDALRSSAHPIALGQ